MVEWLAEEIVERRLLFLSFLSFLPFLLTVDSGRTEPAVDPATVPGVVPLL